MKTPFVPFWRLLLALLALRAAPALAHAGLPETTNVSLRRGSTSDMLVGASFGAVISRDGGETWRWICPEGMGIGAWRPERYHWLSNGDIIAAAGNPLVRSRDGGCSWTTHAAFTDTWVTSLGVHPTDERLMYLTTGKPSVANGIYRSEDGGETWTAVVAPRADVRYSALRVAPGDPRWLYVSGHDAEGLFLMRSEDGGETWTRLSQPLPEFRLPYDLVIQVVSEASPEVIWAKVSAQGYSYLLKSTDGGATLTQVLEVADVIIGTESSADGRTVWTATPVFLYRGREGEPFSALPLPNGNACARREGGMLYGCGSSWVHEWALARSDDEGTTWDPLFRLIDIQGAHLCPEQTAVQQACPSRWPQLATLLGSPTPPIPDAGNPEPEPPVPPKEDGCSAAAGLAPTALLFLALGLARSSWRRLARRS